jgi:hypothetical protein
VFWANRTNKVVGVTLLLLPALSIIGFLASAPIGDIDPFDRASVEELLHSINDNRRLFILSIVPFVLTDTIVLVAVAPLLYLTFYDRSQSLALIGAFGILTSVAAFAIHEVVSMTLPFLAADLFNAGGPGSIPPGDPTILQSARTLSVIQGLMALFGQTGMGFGLIAFGVLLAWAPKGIFNPPRWLGALGILAGTSAVFTWLFLVNHTAGGIVTLVAETATMVMLITLGVWLLRQPAQSSRI